MREFNPSIPYTVPQITSEQLRLVESDCVEILKRAHIAIAKIEGFLSGLPTTQIMLANPIYLQEALASSEIEDINTTLLDVLEQQLRPSGNKSDSQLVVNYYHALMWGRTNIHKFGLTNRLITGLHSQLIPEGSGAYRRLQVFIADGRGSVRYTPPEAQTLGSHIIKWENLVNNNNSIDPLVVAAAGHYMFEAIHPFEDGNGRTGRMLLTLHLMQANLLSAPVVHVSQYINANRTEYYLLLRRVTANGELGNFVRYILKGFAIQAEHGFRLLQHLQTIQNDFQARVKKVLPAIYSVELVEQLFLNPVHTPARLAENLDIHRITASKYLRLLSEQGLLTHAKRGRNMYYINSIMLEALNDSSKLETKRSEV